MITEHVRMGIFRVMAGSMLGVYSAALLHRCTYGCSMVRHIGSGVHEGGYPVRDPRPPDPEESDMNAMLGLDTPMILVATRIMGVSRPSIAFISDSSGSGGLGSLTG